MTEVERNGRSISGEAGIESHDEQPTASPFLFRRIAGLALAAVIVAAELGLVFCKAIIGRAVR